MLESFYIFITDILKGTAISLEGTSSLGAETASISTAGSITISSAAGSIETLDEDGDSLKANTSLMSGFTASIASSATYDFNVNVIENNLKTNITYTEAYVDSLSEKELNELIEKLEGVTFKEDKPKTYTQSNKKM